ncbi:hypothetical protein KAH27_09535 [bacterium]|nr:hypothetical protein [bacterium]
MKIHSEAIKRFLRFALLFGTMSIVIILLMQAQTPTLSGPFELEASEQWIVRQDRPGEIVTRHTLGRRKAIQEMRLYRFPDEDILSVNLISNLTEGTWVKKKQPVLDFYSLADNANKKILEARVERLTEQTNIYRNGELQARYEQALALVALAETNLLTYTPLIKRRRGLVKTSILSEDELQTYESEYYRRLQDVQVAKSEAFYRKSQASPGVIAMADAELEEAERELELVQNRLAAHLVRTPIEGRITRSSGDPAILLRVLNEDKLIARIVVPVIFKDKINIGDKILLDFAGHQNYSVESHIEHIVVQSVPMLGQSILHVLVPVDNSNKELSVSMTGNAVLTSIKMNPLRIIIERIKSAFRKKRSKN